MRVVVFFPAAVAMALFVSAGNEDLYRLSQQNDTRSITEFVYLGARVAANEGDSSFAILVRTDTPVNPSTWVYPLKNQREFEELYSKLNTEQEWRLVGVYDTAQYFRSETSAVPE